jgi:glycine/D-amino acid oxidase-like deaminating enzyme
MKSSAEVVICGAGIAGITAAYMLSVRHGVGDILLVDDHAPMSLTSDKSTECYRNWWPGPGDAMVKMMNRSIELMDELARESKNVFHLNRRGYIYVTAESAGIANLEGFANEASSLGAGEIRWHDQPGSPYQPAEPEALRVISRGRIS